MPLPPCALNAPRSEASQIQGAVNIAVTLSHIIAATSRLDTRAEFVMHPPVPKTEGEIASIIDKWRDQYNFVRNYQKDWVLPSPFLRAALRSIMIGNAREYYEQLIDQSISDSELIERAFEYATRKRLDHKKLDADHMDVSGVGNCTHEHHQHNYDMTNYDTSAYDKLLASMSQLQE